MDKYIEDRVINESKYIIDTKDTIRNIAKKFNVSKSTVHKDLRERLITGYLPIYLVYFSLSPLIFNPSKR